MMITIMQLHKCIHRSIVTQLIFIGAVIVLLPPPVYAAVYFMNDGGQKVSELSVADEGQNKGKVVVVGADGQEVTLGVGGGGSCGILCTLLTAKIENGKAIIGAAVPDIEVADPNARLKIIFADILNAKLFQLAMATPELATASVGMMLGIVSADGVNANIGLVPKDWHIDDFFIVRINKLESEIAKLQEERKKREFECTTKTVQIPLERIFGPDPWVVTSSANNPPPNIPSANNPPPNIQPTQPKLPFIQV